MQEWGKKMKGLLLLSCGTNACYHAAKTLKERFHNKFRIIGADVNERHLISTPPFLDNFFRVPFSDAPGYYDKIREICKAERPDFILPSFDLDQQMFWPENPDLLGLGVKSLSTPKESLKYYKSKDVMAKRLAETGITVPRQYEADELLPEGRYFAKPLSGAGSIGAREATGREILNCLDCGEKLVIQEICTKPEYTLECFWLDGRLSSVARERIAHKAGVCVKARIFSSPELESVARKFVLAFDVPMFFNLQFMKNQSDKFAMTDVNLRLAGGGSMSAAAGWDNISALAEVMLGRGSDAAFSHLKLAEPEQYVVRAYTDIVTKAG
jgi:hypothetical protein